MLFRGVLAGCVGGALALAQATGPLSQMSMPTVERSTVVRAVLPAWVALPPTARILTSEGLVVRPLRNSGVTDENARVGVLVGAMSNAGRCARQVRAFLQYTDTRWKPVGEPIESEARVSNLDPDGMLPYRFRLKRNDDFATPPSGYLVLVVEDGRPPASTLEWETPGPPPARTACEPPATRVATEVTSSRSTLRGYRVSGRLTVTTGAPIRSDAVTLTALLRDADGDVLDVLVGVPKLPSAAADATIAPGTSVPFELVTRLPLGKAVKQTDVFVDILPDAITQP